MSFFSCLVDHALDANRAVTPLLTETTNLNQSRSAPLVAWVGDGATQRSNKIDLAADWFHISLHSTAVPVVNLLRRDGSVIQRLVTLYAGDVIRVPFHTLEIVGVRSAGVLEIHYGVGEPNYEQGLFNGRTNFVLTQHTYSVLMTDYKLKDAIGFSGNDAHILVSDSVVNQRFTTSNSTILLGATASTANFEYLLYGYVTLGASDPVFGTPFVMDFSPVCSFSAVIASAVVQPWMHPAIVYSRTAAGVTAGATPPDRTIAHRVGSLYQSPFFYV